MTTVPERLRRPSLLHRVMTGVEGPVLLERIPLGDRILVQLQCRASERLRDCEAGLIPAGEGRTDPVRRERIERCRSVPCRHPTLAGACHKPARGRGHDLEACRGTEMARHDAT